MKGATAEPCASRISPPNTSSMSRIGASQNFFRTRRNAQSSARIDMMLPAGYWLISELVLHRFRFDRRTLARNPVGLKVGTPLERQHVLAEKPHDPTGRRHRYEEYH